MKNVLWLVLRVMTFLQFCKCLAAVLPSLFRQFPTQSQLHTSMGNGFPLATTALDLVVDHPSFDLV